MDNHTDEALLLALGQRIRALRNERDMSLQDLAYKVGMEKSNLSIIENGRSNPQLLTYAKLAAALGVTLSELTQIDFPFHQFMEAPPTYTPRKHKK
jgi:transcriptional regulator with XRE-family HTH domain